MRTLEIIQVFYSAVILFGLGAERIRKSRAAFLYPLGLIGLLVVHGIFEGPRWQMIPVYLGSVLIVAGWALALLRPETHISAAAGWGAGISLSVLILLGTALAALIPVPGTPAPAGPFAVGSVIYDWSDPAREELWNENGGPRRLPVQVWYPAEAVSGEPLPWLERADLIAPAMAEWVGMPGWFLGHLRYSPSHSYAEAELAAGQDRYPVLIYSHGWGGFSGIAQDQVEVLAANGYIVVAPTHSYAALATAFPDGTALAHNPEILPDDLPRPEEIASEQVLRDVFADDLSFVLSQLETLNESDPRFAGRLDLDHLGVYGHSTGGGAALIFCTREPRCDAALGQDAWVEDLGDERILPGAGKPLLLLNSEAWNWPENESRQRDILADSGAEAYFAVMSGTTHYDFVMVPLLSPLAPVLGFKGPLDGERVVEINHAVLRAFFDATLRGGGAALQRLDEDYPETQIERIDAVQ